MKKKLSIEIIKMSESLEIISKLVAHHNSDEVDISLKEIVTFLKVRAAVYPTLRNSKGYIIDDGSLIITDDGLEANIILKYS